MSDPVFFFGCNEQTGHHLISGQMGMSVRDFECDRYMIPKDHHLDGTFIFLPRPERKGEGALTYLPGTDRTVLAWWGSPFDARGAVNNAIIVFGKATVDEVWAKFTARYPRLAQLLPRPTIVRGG